MRKKPATGIPSKTSLRPIGISNCNRGEITSQAINQTTKKILK
jgi:hypothetical protein